MKERVQFVKFTLYEFGHNILRKLQKKGVFNIHKNI